MLEAEKDDRYHVAKGQPWLCQLWLDIEDKKPCGYAMFLNPILIISGAHRLEIRAYTV